MTRLLIFAAGVFAGVLAAMKLTWSREPIEPAWREDDDGIQPADPWPGAQFDWRPPCDARYVPGRAWSGGWCELRRGHEGLHSFVVAASS